MSLTIFFFKSQFIFDRICCAVICCNSITGDQIATKLCTCRNSTAVMSCAQFGSGHIIRIWIKAQWNFQQIRIVLENCQWNGPIIWSSINSLPARDTTWWQTKILVNNGSDNGLLPDGNKPLPEPMLTRNYWHPSQCNFTENAQDMLANIFI